MVVGKKVARRSRREAEVVGVPVLPHAAVIPVKVVNPFTKVRRETLQVPIAGVEGAVVLEAATAPNRPIPKA